MATLTRQNLSSATSITSNLVACTGAGDVVDNTDGKTLLHVNNASGGALTVTVTAVVTSGIDQVNGPYTISSVVKSVPTLGQAIIGPFPTASFNNGSAQIAITYSAVTSLTIAAYKLP